MLETPGLVDSSERTRKCANRILIVLGLAATLVGVLWDQALITWLNATLL